MASSSEQCPLCSGLRGHKRLQDAMVKDFEADYKLAQREVEQLTKLYRDACWYKTSRRAAAPGRNRGTRAGTRARSRCGSTTPAASAMLPHTSARYHIHRAAARKGLCTLHAHTEVCALRLGTWRHMLREDAAAESRSGRVQRAISERFVRYARER